jgi:lactoylglutathione lyase
LVTEGDLVAQHLTLHGTHRASTMPLPSGTEPSGEPVTWTFIHLWRVADGTIAEHWACRDDMSLLLQARRPSAGSARLPSPADVWQALSQRLSRSGSCR